MKNLLKIYEIFKSKKTLKDKESLSDINRITKAILQNKKKFRNYFLDYNKKTEVYSFKRPGVAKYPVLQKKSLSLIPLNKTKNTFYEDLKEKSFEEKNKNQSILSNRILFQSPKDSFYKNKMRHNLKVSKSLFRNRILKIAKKKIQATVNSRYNSLISDFFHKWNIDKIEQDILFNQNENNKMNDNINNFNESEINSCYMNDNSNYKHIINDKYSELKYDDNLIFNTDYSDFINERINFIQKNDIQNIKTKLESNFNDLNKNEIKLRLESIKIYFKPIRSKINTLNKDLFSKKIVLNIPLYFAFLFCAKDVDFFKYILLSCITFSKNEKIIFNEQLIKPTLNALFIYKKDEISNNSAKNTDKNKIKSYAKKKTVNYRKTSTKEAINFRLSSKLKSNKNINDYNDNNLNSANTFNMNRNSLLESYSNINKKTKKDIIIHSNKKNENNNYYNNQSEEEKNNTINKRDIKHYDEYIFIWETNDITYLVNIQMPIIYFNYENLKEEIGTFCDKNLFLYMYKNNFINWDFYSLNYLFSLKIFRKYILKSYSISKKFILNNIMSKKNNIKDEQKYMNKTSIDIKSKKSLDISSKEDKKFEFDNSQIINRDKNRSYNIINENNESYIFFYTDENNKNSLVKMYSYLIIIDYDKLNPKLRWKYCLDFKLMKKLNEITKYESLETFLPKIIKTDFQNGFLSLNFDLFNDFNIAILEYEKKNLNSNNITSNMNNYINSTNTMNKNKGNSMINPNENEELFLDIKFPTIKEEKLISEKDDRMIFKRKNIDLDLNFLQDINKFKMDFWSKNILEIINKNEDQITFNLSPNQNISDKKYNIKKTETFNNTSPWSYAPRKMSKKYLKSTSSAFPRFDN